VAARGRCLCDDDGRPTHFPGIAVEITGRRAMESALRASEMRTRQALEAADIGAWEVTPELGEQQSDMRARALLGFESEDAVSVASVYERVHADDRERLAKEVSEALADRDRGLDSQYRVVGHGGGQTWVHVRGRLVSAADEPARMVGTVRDVTPQRVAEEQRALLTHELNHRIKNILAVVQSIVSQSLRRSETPALATQAIGERLAALGRAHDLLTRTSWAAAPLQSVVEGAVKVYEKRPAQIVIAGPQVLLNSKSALAFAMALHELMTNAMKYGALASDTGQVDVNWRRVEQEGARKLVLSWNESGGPQVTAPARIGFGARLMQALSRDLGGESHAAYNAAGLEWTLVADLSAIEEALMIGDS
jgi:PAS domain S-box-containing protein